MTDLYSCRVEPGYNERPRDCQNLFAVTRFRYIEVGSFFFVYFFWGKENRSLYRGLRYIEVRYIVVNMNQPFFFFFFQKKNHIPP